MLIPRKCQRKTLFQHTVEEGGNCPLHPLILTALPFILAKAKKLLTNTANFISHGECMDG